MADFIIIIMCRTWKSWVRPLKRVPIVPLLFLLTKETVYTCFGTSAVLIDLWCFFIDGSGIQEEAAARAVWLGLHAARGDYGDCDSASVPRLGSARPRGGCSSTRTMCGGGCGSLTRCAMFVTPLGVVLASQSFIYLLPLRQIKVIYNALQFRSTVCIKK